MALAPICQSGSANQNASHTLYEINDLDRASFGFGRLMTSPATETRTMEGSRTASQLETC